MPLCAVDASEKAARLLSIQSIAEETFGDAEKADLWLHRPLAELGGKSPLVLVQTEAGVRVVKTILGKIAWGATA